MFSKHCLAIAAVCLLGAASFPLIASADPAPPPAAATPSTVKPFSPLQQLHQQCKDEASGQALKGSAKRDAIDACIVNARPDQAKGIQCRKDGMAQGLRHQDLHAYMKSCIKGQPTPAAPPAPGSSAASSTPAVATSKTAH